MILGMKKYGVFILFMILTSFCVEAQNVEKNLDQDLVYSREVRMGAKLHTGGFGLSFAKTKIINRHKKSIWQFELQEIRHEKQKRIVEQQTSRPDRSYIYGKQNNFFNLNLNYNRHKVIAEYGRKNGVEIVFHYGLGFSLGILKPYYLNIDISREGDPIYSDIKYSDDNDNFLNDFNINTSSSFLIGIDEIKLHPGLQFQSGFIFDWAGSGEIIKAVELGLMINAYYKRVPIMVIEKNNIAFFNVYARLVFGRKSID